MRPTLLVGVLSGLSAVTASFAPAPAAKAVVDAVRAENIIRAAFNGPDVLKFAKGDHDYFVIPPKYGSYGTKGNSSTGEAPLTRKTVIDVLLNRRQSCAAGYGYCASAGGCCPSSNRCCSYGYCLEPGNVCCPNGPCDSGELCCGQNHCYPTGAVCCDDESYCDSGNHCYHVPGYTRDVCCTDSSCTAYYTDGATVTRTSSTTRSTTPPPTATTTPSSGGEYYTFTYTYIYYSYYWSSRDASVRVVRSTDYTTSTNIVVYATDTDAATSEYDDLQITLSPYTPAAATSLRAQAGETTTLYDDQTATFDSVATGTTTSTSRRTTSTSTTAEATPTLNVDGTGGTSGASRLITASNRVLTVWAALSAATGILMVVL